MSSSNDIRVRTDAWRDAGIIDAAQSDRIVAFEAGRGTAATPDRDRVAALFGVIGGLLVGLGVLLTVAANWDSIGDTTKLAVIVTAMVVAYAAALWADAREAPRWAGTVGYIVGALVFAAGVFLVGQIYNVHAHDPLSFLVIAIVATVLALVVDRVAIGSIAAAAWAAWGVHELVLSLDDVDSTHGAAVLLASSVLLALTVLACSWLLEGVAARHADDDPASWSAILGRVDLIGYPMRNVALLGLLGLLTGASFTWHAEGTLTFDGVPLQLVVLGVASVVAVLALMRLATLAHRTLVGSMLLVAIASALLAAIVLDDLLAAILANLLLAAGGVGLALLGLVESQRDSFVWGVIWIVALIATRYLDFFVSLELGGLGFIGAGVLLLGVAWLVGRTRRIWRQRDEVAS